MARDMTGVAAGAAMAVASLGTSIANVALPGVAAAFGVPVEAAQGVVVGYLVAVTVLVAGAGRLGDRMGHRRVLMAGVALFAAAGAAGTAAPTVGWLVAARVVQGAGAAAMLALPVALLRATVPAGRIGRAMGLAGTMSAVGTAAGPALGGVLVGLAGWQAVFVAMTLAALAVLALLAALPAGQRPRAAGQGDAAGTVLLAGAVTAWALAMTLGGLAAVGLAAVAAALAGAFLRAERRAPAPLLPPTVLDLPGMRPGLAGSAVAATVMMATLVAGPFWLTDKGGLGAAQAGLVLAAGPVISALAGVPSGRAVDRFGAAAVLRAGLWLMLAGAVGLAALPGWLGVAGWLAPVAVLTPGYQLFQAANTVQVMAAAPAAQRGALAGVLALARNLGLVTGAALMGALYAGAGLPATFGLAAAMLALALRTAAARTVVCA